MAFSFVKDSGGKIYGVWVENTADANNQTYIIGLFLRGGLKSEQIAGKLRVVLNHFDNKGGAFVMLGSYLAPGEQTSQLYQKSTPKTKISNTVSADKKNIDNSTPQIKLISPEEIKKLANIGLGIGTIGTVFSLLLSFAALNMGGSGGAFFLLLISISISIGCIIYFFAALVKRITGRRNNIIMRKNIYG